MPDHRIQRRFWGELAAQVKFSIHMQKYRDTETDLPRDGIETQLKESSV